MPGKRARGLVDLHSHLVPGVDDGAPTVDDALEGIGRMVDEGMSGLVTTPHIDGSLAERPEEYRIRMEAVDRAWGEIAAAVGDRFPDLDFRRGHEVMLDVPDPDLSDERLRLGGTRFVLVEWPRLRVPPGTDRVVARIRAQGLIPVIAHPERYHGMDRELAVAAEWRRLGAYLQVSHGSLAGRYGLEVRERAFLLLRRGYADYLSTDFHGRPRLPLYVSEARETLSEVGAEDVFESLASLNPSRLLDDEEPLPVDPVEVERRLWDRLVGVFRAGSGVGP